MDASSWLLIVLTLVVVVILLPQMVKSRHLMGMARTEDRFSGQMRLLDTTENERVVPSVQPRLHQQSGGNMERPITDSVKLAKEIWRYNQLRAARQAAITTQRAAASRRAALALGMMVALGVCLVLSLASVIGVAWLGVPCAGLAGICAWGVLSARRGRMVDAQMRGQIRELEKTLAASPAGRRALQGARRPLSGSGQKWVAVAQAANRKAAEKRRAGTASTDKASTDKMGTGKMGTGKISEVSADEASRGKNSGGAVEAAVSVSGPAAKAATKVFSAVASGAAGSGSETVDSKKGEKRVNQAGLSREVKRACAVTGEEGEEQSRAWTPIPVPPPTYTLLAAAPAKSAPAWKDSAMDTSGVRVPLRPKTAQYLPAGEALSAAELAAPAIDLEEILSKRRAAGA